MQIVQEIFFAGMFIYLFHYEFLKKILREIIYFLLNVYFLISLHEYNFSGSKKWLFSKRFVLFLKGFQVYPS